MADFGPNDVYANIPPIDSKGRQQLPMFLRWNANPIGNDASNLSALNPNMQRVISRARSDNPNLSFVIGNGKRTATDQDWAKSVGWSQVGSKDGGDALVHMNGQAADLWGLDANNRVQFDPTQQQQISLAMKKAAQEEGVSVNWGGDWKSFKDAPHFELGGASAQPSGAPEGPPALHSANDATPAQGTTLNSSNVIDTLSRNIAQIESGGFKNPYSALGPTVPGRGQAIGKYQVMPENVPGWTQAALGHSLTPEQFHADPTAQEAVFRDQMQRSLQLYGPKDAASIWFTGKPYNVAGGAASDVNGTTNASYVARATAGLDDSGTFKPGAAAVAAASAAPGTTINTPAAGLLAGGSSGALPGFGTKQASDNFLAGLKKAGITPSTGQASDQQPDMRPSPIMSGPGLRNASSPQSIGMQASQLEPELTHYSPQMYGASLNSQPLSWPSSPIPAPPQFQGAGLQQAAPGLGTSLNSMQMAYGLSPQQLQMMMNPMMFAGEGGGYG